MGIVRMIGSTVATLGIAGVLLQATGAYDVNHKVVKPVVEAAQTNDYSNLKSLQLVNISDTDYVWDNLTPEQRQDLGKRGIGTLTLEQRTDFVRKEWPHIKPEAKYSIVRAELESMLERFYR